MLVVRRIHVTYQLRLRPEQREVAERVHGFHADACPVYRTIRGCVDTTTSLDMEDLAEPLS
ncbi:MAG: OsmC family protein [Chloroflexota bacterium]|nr:OsmC family protein [Chloroflexota bacterium]